MDELITEKTYTQKELEKIVEKRLLRERRNASDLRKIRELVEAIRANENFRDISNEDLVILIQNALPIIGCGNADINNEAEQTADGACADDKAGKTGKTGNTEALQTEKTSPEGNIEKAETLPENVFSEVSDNFPVADTESESESESETEISDSDGQNDASEKIRRELMRFIDAYGEERLKRLIKDRAFSAFCRGKDEDLCELFEDYTDFLSEVSKSEEAKRYRTAQSVLASTGYSQCASGGVDYGSMLTENQKSIAKASGMSYKQYAELLSQIPSKNTIRKFFGREN